MLLLIGCAPPADDSGRALDTDGATPPPVHAAPSLDADGVGAALDAVLALGLPSPLPPVTLWDDMLAQGDDDCPPPEAPEGSLLAQLPCTALSGYAYEGYGSASTGVVDVDGDAVVDVYRIGFRADGSITDPGGDAFRFGAEARFDQVLGEDSDGSYTGELLGTLSYPAADEGWLAEGVSSALTFAGADRGGGVWGMHVDGGYTVGETSIAFTGFSVHETCAQGPAGTLSLRGAEGAWYDVAFDTSACDACGEVTFDGDTSLGRACVSVTPAFDAAWEALVAARDAAGGAP